MTPDRSQQDSRVDADPSAWGELLAGIYREIGDRAMRDLPIFNDALEVEAVGFRRFGDNTVGIMVTPWFMNVVLSPGDDVGELPGSSLRRSFPAGDIDFTVSEVASAGRVASCSLFSPMFQFSDMASARATASAALDALMAPAEDDGKPGGRVGSGAIGRRDLLRGRLTERRG